MTTDIATRENKPVGSFDPTDVSALQYLGLNPSDPRSRAVVAVCRTYGLDPILKHVIVIPKGGVYLTRDGLLHIAHRSGQLDGIVVEQEPTLDKDAGEWVARVSVYRKDMRHPFTFPGRYPVNGGNRQYAPEMALKAAEAHALRRAFDVAGLPTEDEQRDEVAPAAPTFVPAATPPIDTPLTNTDNTTEDAEVVDEPRPLTKHTRGRMFAILTELGIDDEDEQKAGMARIIGRPVESRSSLTEDEAQQIVDHLAGVKRQRDIADVQGGQS